MLDTVLVAVLGLYAILFAVVAYVYTVKRQFLRGTTVEGAMSGYMTTLATKAKTWMFVEKGKTEDGKTIMEPSPQFKELVALAVPEFIGQGMLWAKQNIKLGQSGIGSVLGGGGGGGIAAFAPEILKQVPKEWRGIAAIFMQYGKPIMQFLGVGGKTAAEGGAAAGPMKVLGQK